MNSYRYRVTVEQVADGKGQPVDGRSLVFEAACHDEILGIVDRVRERRVLPNANAAAALAVGLKLFGEVVIAERTDPMFAEMHAALGNFIRGLKARTAAGASGTTGVSGTTGASAATGVSAASGVSAT